MHLFHYIRKKHRLYSNMMFTTAFRIFFLSTSAALVALVEFSSCTYDAVILPPPDSIQPFADSFVHQAKIRGLDVAPQLSEVTFLFGNIEKKGTSGNCNLRTHVVLLDSVLWGKYSPTKREFLVAHELGHCVLGRKHTDNMTPRFECVSIMRGEVSCWCNFVSPNWKKYYYDELFGVSNSIDADIYNFVEDFAKKPLNLDTLSFVEDSTITNARYLIHEGTMLPNKAYALGLQVKSFKNFQDNIIQIYFGEYLFSVRNKYTNEIYLSNRKDFSEYYYFVENNALDLEKDILNLTILFRGKYIALMVNDKLMHTFEAQEAMPVLNARTNALNGPVRVSSVFGSLKD